MFFFVYITFGYILELFFLNLGKPNPDLTEEKLRSFQDGWFNSLFHVPLRYSHISHPRLPLDSKKNT